MQVINLHWALHFHTSFGDLELFVNHFEVALEWRKTIMQVIFPGFEIECQDVHLWFWSPLVIFDEGL